MANLFYFWQKFLSKDRLEKKENSNAKFAFIIHPRNVSDAARKYSFLRFFPKSLVRLICRLHSPLIASQIVGLKSLNSGEPINGWILICPLTAKQLLNDRRLAKKRIKETISLAQKLGVKLVGIGELIPSVTSAGEDLIDDLKIGITHGRALTVGISLEGIKKILKIKNINLEEVTVGIVGATGTIGKAMAKLLIEEKVKKFILIAKSNAYKYLTELKEEMKKINPSLVIKISSNISSIKNAELVIVATSSSETLIKSEDLKYRAIVYDVTQPQNISPEVIKERKDVLVIDGGLVKTPGINYHFDLGLSPETTFACMAETLILAAEGKYNCRLVGEVDLEKVKEMMELAKKYNFTHAPFTFLGEPVIF